VAIGGCGGGSHSARSSTGAAVGTPVSHQSTATASVAARAPAIAPPPAAPSPTAPSPDLLRLQGALTNALNAGGPQTGALVYDLTAHATLFSLRANVGRPPASVEKLYTTVAALAELGPNATLTTTVLGTGHLGPGGVWHGDLYIRGGGDPTFGDGGFNQVWEQGYGPTANQLVSQLAGAGIHRVTGLVIADTSLFDGAPGGPATNYAPDTPDYGGQLGALTYDHGSTGYGLGPGAYAVKEIVRTMNGMRIAATAAKFTAVTPPGAHQLASVTSPPLSVLLKLMDVPSDDLFADMLAKQLGARFGAGGTITAGAQVISQMIGSFGLHPSIVDGSGLSRDDSSSPGEVVDLLRVVAGTSIGHELDESLPVVGVSGTVRTIGTRTPAQGHCIAKTGTLNFVTNLAGYCSARDHHRLAFALMIDGPPNWTAFGLLTKMVGAIARY
jgi:serine-type D-Ala-D-Ala carboxypeptidase/endopeptidase (penicillin-binding protein 4)